MGISNPERHENASGAAVGNDNPRSFHVFEHLTIGEKLPPLTVSRFIGAVPGLQDDIFLKDIIPLQFVYFLNQPVKGLLMSPYCYKNHAATSEDTPQVNRLRVDLFHFLPLNNKPIRHGVNQLPGQGRRIDAVEHFNIDGFRSKQLAQIEKRYGNRGTAGDD